MREEHRQDLVQLPSYAGPARVEHVIACLVYPWRLPTWESYRECRRLFLKARLPTFGGAVSVWLTATPRCANPERLVEAWIGQIESLRSF